MLCTLSIIKTQAHMHVGLSSAICGAHDGNDVTIRNVIGRERVTCLVIFLKEFPGNLRLDIKNTVTIAYSSLGRHI